MVSIATSDEIRAIIAMAKQYDGGFSQHVTVNVEHATKTYLGMVEAGIAIVFCLKDGDKIIGGLAAIKYPDINCGVMTAVECFWFVNPESRGKGLELLSIFEKWAKQEQCQRIALIHLADSYPETLEKLYIRKGYKLTEKHYVREVTL